MVIIAVFCGVLSILISCIAVYQSEHFNKLSRELNKDTKLMIDCNEKSINNLHSTLDEIINKEETKLETKEEQVTFIKNEMVLIKMNNYNVENKFNILHSIMYLSNILASKSISDLDMWLDNDEQKVILKLSKDINREDYKNIEISLEQLERYGIWVSLNVDLYRDIKEKIEIS
ncbi:MULTISPECIES: hypothetical protein [Clostridia]|uniref:Uncharacterized protein n=2 Tax=Clostridia TaxID=186801 RepID=A0A8I0DMD9_9CLOT|nr:MULTISPECIES: hypothetical protein [Clostridia]MBC5639234.1 hypothetical protein [Clostridium lentum]MBC5653327.1 hypothetical protein [Blautia lenta]MEE0567249.1 hypothetical protein [Clostridium sp.]